MVALEIRLETAEGCRLVMTYYEITGHPNDQVTGYIKVSGKSSR